MSTIDVIIIVAYLLGSMLIGLLLRGKDKSSEDFFTASGGLTSLFSIVVVGLSIASALFSGISFVMYPGVVYSSGITVIAGIILICMPVSYLVLRYWFLPRYLGHGCRFPYDIVEERFGLGTRMLASGLFALMRIGWMAAMVYAPTLAIMTMGKLDARWFWPLILAQGLSSTIFTVFVGVRGVVITDALQMIVIGLGIAATIGFALTQIPVPLSVAWSDVMHSGRLIHLDFSLDLTKGLTFWTITIGIIVGNLGNYVADQMSLQRYLATGSASAAGRSFLVNVVGVYAILILLAAIGMSLFVYYSHVPDPTLPMRNGVIDADRVFPHFVATRLPTGIAGLLMAAIMAASSMTPGINTVAGVLTVDFHARIWPRTSKAQQLRWARYYSLIVGVASTIVAGLLADARGLFELVQVILGVFSGPLLACVVLAVSGIRLSGRAMSIGMVVGCLVGIAATRTSLAGLWVAPLSVITSMLVSLAVGLLDGSLFATPRVVADAPESDQVPGIVSTPAGGREVG
jgi:SSS family solute:Na+ symporter